MPNPKLETYKNKATGTVYDYTDAAAQAALAGILDGTDIESFEDVETALATKVDKVTGKGLSTNDYDNTAKGIVDNIQSNVIANTKLIKDTVGWSGKNLIPLFRKSDYVNSGITFHQNADLSVTVSGTATAGVGFDLTGVISQVLNGDYILSSEAVLPQGLRLTCEAPANTNNNIALDNKKQLTFNNVTCVNYRIWVDNGTVISNPITIKPMLRSADILDDTYEPYFGSTAFPRSEQAVLGAGNFLIRTPATSVPASVTLTDNDDDTILINGNVSSSSWINISANQSYPKGNFYLKGCPSGGDGSNGYALVLKDETTNTQYFDVGNGIAVTIDDTNVAHKFSTFIRLAGTASFNNLLFEPALVLSLDTPYAPRALPNKALTDMVVGKSLSSADNLDNIKTAGAYSWSSSYPSNVPNNVSYAYMQVLDAGGSIQQVIFANTVIYKRNFGGGAWSSWYMFEGTVVS